MTTAKTTAQQTEAALRLVTASFFDNPTAAQFTNIFISSLFAVFKAFSPGWHGSWTIPQASNNREEGGRRQSPT
ncbi:MAG: hypothetical protein AAGM22_21585, partial [Acidobacteriota bacterium]